MARGNVYLPYNNLAHGPWAGHGQVPISLFGLTDTPGRTGETLSYRKLALQLAAEACAELQHAGRIDHRT